MHGEIVFKVFSGAGNTFGICATDLSDDVLAELSPKLGTDGLLAVSNSTKADVSVRIFNRDGSRASMCGNGVRCLAWYTANTKNLREVSIETDEGIYCASVDSHESITVDMTRKDWDFRPVHLGIKEFSNCPMFYAYTGVPHLVVFLKESLQTYNVEEYGRKLRWHDAFAPQGVNVNFAVFSGGREVKVRVYERGLESESSACGTGAVAVALSASFLRPLGERVYIRTVSDYQLLVSFNEGKRKVLLTGPVEELGEVKLSLSESRFVGVL